MAGIHRDRPSAADLAAAIPNLVTTRGDRYRDPTLYIEWDVAR